MFISRHGLACTRLVRIGISTGRRERDWRRGMKRISTNAVSRMITSATIQSDGHVCVFFDDGKTQTFAASWLADNCSDNRQPGTSQKVRNAPLRGHVESIDVIEGGRSLQVKWSSGDAISRFECEALSAMSVCRGKERSMPKARPNGREWADAVEKRTDTTWIEEIATQGITVLERVPPRSSSSANTMLTSVERTGDVLGPVLRTLYGTVFDVRSVRRPINIAYSDEALPLHQDLAYYESPPGIQLLHCLAQSSSGGESVFVDAHAVARTFRETMPSMFRTLRRVPATFQKDHEDRERPAKFFYRRPHIVTADGTDDGDISAVFWSPPFEGPLLGVEDPTLVEEYYAAYRAFYALIEDKTNPHRLEFKLRPGELVAWNQRRVLHGRNRIVHDAKNDGDDDDNDRPRRHLQGCYVNIDDFMSTYRHRCQSDGHELHAVGNRSSLEQFP